jgi:hypothetical protein
MAVDRFMTSPLALIRVGAWIVALGAAGVVLLGYDSLPAEIPLTRWNVAPKTLFIALRIPLVNLLSLGLIELLSPALHRAKDLVRADAVVGILLSTAAAKAVIEAVGILAWTAPHAWTLIPLLAVLLTGLGAAALLARGLLRQNAWRELRMTRLETTAAAVLLAGIAALNAPLVLR